MKRFTTFNVALAKLEVAINLRDHILLSFDEFAKNQVVIENEHYEQVVILRDFYSSPEPLKF